MKKTKVHTWMEAEQLRTKAKVQSELARLWGESEPHESGEACLSCERLATTEGYPWCDQCLLKLKLEMANGQAALMQQETVRVSVELERANEILNEAEFKLKNLQSANRSFAQQLADATSNREFWYKEAKNAKAELVINAKMLADLRDLVRQTENERDKVRQDAQDQSDEVQELWLSPVEAEGLRRQLVHIQNQFITARKAVEWLWGFYNGNTLIAKPGYKNDICDAWEKLLIAVNSAELEIEETNDES